MTQSRVLALEDTGEGRTAWALSRSPTELSFTPLPIPGLLGRVGNPDLGRCEMTVRRGRCGVPRPPVFPIQIPRSRAGPRRGGVESAHAVCGVSCCGDGSGHPTTRARWARSSLTACGTRGASGQLGSSHQGYQLSAEWICSERRKWVLQSRQADAVQGTTALPGYVP